MVTQVPGSPILQGGSANLFQNTANPQNKVAGGSTLQPAGNFTQPILPGYNLVSGQAAANTKKTNSTLGQGNALLEAINRLTAASAVPAPVYAPNLNLTSVNNRALARAEKSQNPYYTKLLHDTLAQSQFEQQQHQTQAQTDTQNFQDTLNQTLQDNATSADRQQVAGGENFDQARIEEAKAQASGGLTGSGIGQGQTLQTELHRNIAEAQSFGDLAKSSQRATQAAGKGQAQVKFDLANYIKEYGVGTNSKGQATLKGAGFETKKTGQNIEKQRLGAVSGEQGKQARLIINKFIQSIADPAQRQAAAQAYGGLYG